jgi:uncharacterized DUF497 family protein
VKYYDWDELKNAKLKAERGICFEDIVTVIGEGSLLDVLHHPNQSKYPNQRIYVVKVSGYVYLVPFTEDKDKYFLKTIYASRKMTKKYLFNRRTQ